MTQRYWGVRGRWPPRVLPSLSSPPPIDRRSPPIIQPSAFERDRAVALRVLRGGRGFGGWLRGRFGMCLCGGGAGFLVWGFLEFGVLGPFGFDLLVLGQCGRAAEAEP